MIGFQISDNNFIDLADITFTCPHCFKFYSDDNDLYLDRINKNKKFNTRINCSCGEKFYLTFDYKGDFVSFK